MSGEGCPIGPLQAHTWNHERTTAAERDGLLQRLEQQRVDLATAYEEAHTATHQAQGSQQRIDKARQLTFKAEGYERTLREVAAALTGTDPAGG